ncbi:WD40 repeat domain-containing protein [Campylobacter novaezeelandiae]|uniref:WD40 repeat domain-containing protein n=1 Tax=Campylobacter novaezeelandiae TaxID=2267891 RepID=UPI0019038CD8|nr:WD40 repeat domain-containing protein [Campylobacter novaezeelandiae]MBK1964691.1 WD40 repeat domain-containing protein [Campylobacter novaezeelandiae]MBK1992949.1 WD40 repeat domain-containing protein [Campylobacter novaezeelandiae]
MVRIFFILTFLVFYSFSYEIKLISNVSSLKKDKNFLYIGTDQGEIFSFNLKNNELKKLFILPKIKSYYDESFSQIYDIDFLENSLLILSEGSFGEKDLFIYKNNQLKKQEIRLNDIRKVFFIDKYTILIASISSEIYLFDIKNSILLKKFKFSQSALGNLQLNEDKTLLVLGFESGEIELFDLLKWKIIHQYKQIHKDNIYQVDFKKNIILSCSTDRRIGVIKNNKENFSQQNFLIYACSLSPDGKFILFSDNNDNKTKVLDTDTLKQLTFFDNENLSVENIIFIDNKNFILSGFSNILLFRSLNESF